MYRSVLHKISPPNKQQGAALLLFILLLIVGASSLLVSKLNKASTQHYRDDVTMKALLKAKEALLGLAVTYPDNPAFSDINAGPGFLPCPDTDGNGSPNTGSCGSKATSTYGLGLIPWEYLGIDEIRDSSGAQLWYSLSNDFRNTPKTFPLNSERAGELSLDGRGDIVAVIIAPGSPICSQNRLLALNSLNYLESSNADTSNIFVSNGVTSGCTDEVTFNDTVLPITRDELMAVVEKRVLGEVDQILKNYKDSIDLLTPAVANDGRYPWLSTFTDPRSSNFDSATSTNEGLLPIHLSDEEFNTTFTVNWNIPSSGGATFRPTGTIPTSDLEQGIQTVTSGICRWKEDTSSVTPTIKGYKTVECSGSVTNAGRTYTFDFGFSEGVAFDGISLGINAPTSSSERTRDVLIGTLPIQSDSTPVIQISDGVSTATVSLENTSSGSIEISGISYQLNVSPGQEEIPKWFITNNWHHLVFVAAANGFLPGGSGNCVAGNDCLTINDLSPNNSIGVLALSAGKAMAGQDRTTAVTSSDYYENTNNTSLDNEFKKNSYPPNISYDPNFNDQVRIVTQ